MSEADDDCEISLEILMKEFEKSEEDIEAGRTIDYSDFKEKFRIKYKILI